MAAEEVRYVGWRHAFQEDPDIHLVVHWKPVKGAQDVGDGDFFSGSC